MAGLYYEQFEIGQVFNHAMSRTVTETDNVLFSTMTHNPALLHLDEEYCKNETEFGQRIVNSCFTLALMVGGYSTRYHARNNSREFGVG